MLRMILLVSSLHLCRHKPFLNVYLSRCAKRIYKKNIAVKVCSWLRMIFILELTLIWKPKTQMKLHEIASILFSTIKFIDYLKTRFFSFGFILSLIIWDIRCMCLTLKYYTFFMAINNE